MSNRAIETAVHLGFIVLFREGPDWFVVDKSVCGNPGLATLSIGPDVGDDVFLYRQLSGCLVGSIIADHIEPAIIYNWKNGVAIASSCYRRSSFILRKCGGGRAVSALVR